MGDTRILIVDQLLVAEGLRRLLEDEFSVVGVTDSASGAVKTALKVKPDIVMLELSLNGTSTAEAALKLRAEVPGVKLIVVSREGDRYALRAALKLGASGYVLKRQSRAELCEAVRRVAMGRRYIAPQLRAEADQAIGLAETKDPAVGFHLTDRQSDVLQLIAAGKTLKEIGAVLGISPKTAEFHKAALMDQLGIRTTAGLTRFAMERGLVAAYQTAELRSDAASAAGLVQGKSTGD